MSRKQTSHGQPAIYNTSLPTYNDEESGALQIDSTGRLIITGTVSTSAPSQPTTLLAFITDIPNAGTRVQLASNTIVNGVIIQAPSTNTGVIYVGGSAVSSTVYGSELQPGQSVGLSIDNTNKVYVDTATNGNDVAVFGA